MNDRKVHGSLMMAAVIAVGITAAMANAAEKQAQQTFSNDSGPAPERSIVVPSFEPIGRTTTNNSEWGSEISPFGGTSTRSNLAVGIRAAAEAVRDAKDEGKAEAQRKLSDLLSNYFDQDTKRREQEVKQIVTV